MSNERKQSMPPHCGNCIFHEWDEDRSTCMHPCKVRESRLAGDVAAMAEDGGMSAYSIAESLLDDALTDQDWQPYDSVCDHWRGRECRKRPELGQEERRIRDAARDIFHDRIEAMLSAGGAVNPPNASDQFTGASE